VPSYIQSIALREKKSMGNGKLPPKTVFSKRFPASTPIPQRAGVFEGKVEGGQVLAPNSIRHGVSFSGFSFLDIS